MNDTTTRETAVQTLATAFRKVADALELSGHEVTDFEAVAHYVSLVGADSQSLAFQTAYGALEGKVPADVLLEAQELFEATLA